MIIYNMNRIDDFDLLFKARENIIDCEFLGEKNGWVGIRKELKKFYVKYGFEIVGCKKDDYVFEFVINHNWGLF